MVFGVDGTTEHLHLFSRLSAGPTYTGCICFVYGKPRQATRKSFPVHLKATGNTTGAISKGIIFTKRELVSYLHADSIWFPKHDVHRRR